MTARPGLAQGGGGWQGLFLEPSPNLLVSVPPSLWEQAGEGANLGSREEAGVLVSPTLPPHHLPGAYLGLSQHDVLDDGWATGLAILQPHIGDLVASDLAVLLAGDRQLPGDVHGGGVQRLHLHLPWWPTGHWGSGRQGSQSWRYGSWLRWAQHTPGPCPCTPLPQERP